MSKKVIINVGRQFGSGGKQVAECLGNKLGIKVFDNEIINEAAKESGFSTELFKKNDERRRILHIGSLFGSNRYGRFTDNVLSEGELFRIQSEVIRSLAEKDDAIFVGRASDYVLRDMDCLDVFVCAPLENRIERVSERKGISREEAGSLIKKSDRERESFYNFFTMSNWGVASNYDICIDSSILGIEGTADFIIDFGKKAGLI